MCSQEYEQVPAINFPINKPLLCYLKPLKRYEEMNVHNEMFERGASDQKIRYYFKRPYFELTPALSSLVAVLLWSQLTLHLILAQLSLTSSLEL